MPKNVCRSLLDRTRLLVTGGLTDGVTEGLREADNDSRVVASEVVQLDRLRRPVVLLAMLRSTNEDVLIVILQIVELE